MKPAPLSCLPARRPASFVGDAGRSGWRRAAALAVTLSVGLGQGLAGSGPGRAAAAATAPGEAPAAAAPGKAPARPARDPFSLSAERFVLPSGLTVLLRRDPAVPRVVVSLWFGVGSRDEQPGRTGFAHLYEHLMFMGTKLVPDNQFDVRMESEGGGNNATTDNDRTFYFDWGPSHLLPTLLWLESERLSNLPQAMTDEKVSLQREVVRNERRQSYENRPYGSAELSVPAAMYPAGHPYSWPVIGSHQDLIAATTEDVKQFFYTYYTPSNATLAVVGDFDPQAARKLIERYFAWMPKQPLPNRSYAAPAAGAGKRTGLAAVTAPVEKRVVLADKVALPRVYGVWHAPPVRSPEFAEAQLLADVVGRGKASRLYRALVVEQKLAQSVEVELEPLTLGSLLSVAVTAQKGVSEPALAAALQAELARLASSPITAAELERARNQRLTELARLLETPLGQSQLLQQMVAWFGDPAALKDLVGRIRGVTPQSVQARALVLGLPDANRRLTLSVIPQGQPLPKVVPAVGLTMTQAPAKSPPVTPPQVTPPLDLGQAPALLAARPLPKPKTARFKVGGLDVLLVQRPGTALYESLLLVPSGEAQSPREQAGLASAVAAMLSEGAGGRSATEFADALEALGATLRATATQDFTQVTLSVLAERYGEAAPLLLDAAARPDFREADWQRVRGERLAQIARLRDEPRYAAERAQLMSLLGERHPYALPLLGDETTLGRIQVADLRAFHAARYRPGAVTLIVAGDLALTKAEAERLAAPLAPWARDASKDPAGVAAAAPEAPAPAPAPQHALVLVDRPGAPQTELRVANLALPRTDPDRATAMVANALLGGMFTSRLNQNLREKHGYTYGAFSQFVRLEQTGWFGAQSAVRTDATVPALGEVLAELRRLRDEPVSAAELQKGRNVAVQGLVAQTERASGLAQVYAGILRYRLPLDEMARLERGALATTPQQLQRVARAQMRPDDASLVVVGDLARFEAELRKLPALSGLPVQRRDADGRPITVSSGLAPVQTPGPAPNQAPAPAKPGTPPAAPAAR